MTAQRLDDVLLLTGESIAVVRYAVRVAVAARHRNGYPIDPRLAELAAAVAEPGTSDIPEPEPAQHDPQQWIDIQETAQMLGCSHRQARRLAPQLDGRIHAGRWLIPRAAVTQHLEGHAA